MRDLMDGFDQSRTGNRAIEMAEQFADGEVAEEIVLQAWDEAFHYVPPPREEVRHWITTPTDVFLLQMILPVRGFLRDSLMMGFRADDLVRHIIGNPFRPCPAPDHWSATIVQLADALYTGQNCSFALHEALLEAGHTELAEHFRQEQWHPKGCWVLDMILDKK
jgi:hypothetical protein